MPPSPQIQQDISVPNLLNFPQSNFVVFPVWNYSQNEVHSNFNF